MSGTTTRLKGEFRRLAGGLAGLLMLLGPWSQGCHRSHVSPGGVNAAAATRAADAGPLPQDAAGEGGADDSQDGTVGPGRDAGPRSKADAATDGGLPAMAAGIGGPGFEDVDAFRARQQTYLEFATESFRADSIPNVIAHAERALREPSFVWDSAALEDGFSAALEKVRAGRDTSDFEVLYFINLLYGYGSQLPSTLVETIQDVLLGYEYWYTEPTPADQVDEKYYWSENHRLIFHTAEYLMGQRYPEVVFRNDGQTGSAHRAHARGKILQWLQEKVDVGFSEWHSDVYYQKDVTALLTLVEWADEAEIARRATMLLDLVLFDIALHLHDGNFGATHGRSYMKDKSRARDQDTFGLAKLLFATTDEPYVSRGDPGAVLMARARNYVLPSVLHRVAESTAAWVDRERMGVPIDPLASMEESPVAPYGYAFTPEYIDFWWERGAQPLWQLVPASIETINTYDLWAAPTFSQFRPLYDLVGGNVRASQVIVSGLAGVLSFALLSEANTVTYRAADVMLSTVQDLRPGLYSDQGHVWQATLGADAVVFTTHPLNEPFSEQSGWLDDDGYWTGSATLPRSAQVGQTSLSLYAPRVAPSSGVVEFDYLASTHAFFPVERFDEVVRQGRWTFGRLGDGYVGLWSWRMPEWRTYAADEAYLAGMTEPFDLVASGGADNVWIAEVGSAGDGSFSEFQERLLAAAVDVMELPARRDGLPPGFQVTYDSPATGQLSFGQTGPLTVDGQEIPLRHDLRYDNPWAQVPFRSQLYELHDAMGGLTLDFAEGSRRAF